MFDAMATYLIFTGQIMGGNGLYMIVISREELGYRGHSQIPTRTFMHKAVCVYVGLMSLFIIVLQLFESDIFSLLLNKVLKLKINSFLLRDFIFISSCAAVMP